MVEKDASKTPEKPQERLSDRIGNLADYSRSRLQSSAIDLTARVKEFKPKEALDAVLEAPDRFKREWQKKWCYRCHHPFPISDHHHFLDADSVFHDAVRVP